GPAAAAAPPPAETGGAQRVAVMPFDNASGDAALDSIGTGLQAMLTTDLAEVSAFTLVERARLAAIQGELALAQTAAIDPATAAKVGKLAGATHLIAGAVTVVGATMRLDARLFDVATGEVVLTAKIEGEKDAFFELEKQLVQKIIGATQAKVTAKERAEVARIHTSDFNAFQKFSDGVFAFDHQQYEAAIADLKAAAAMDDEFKLAKLTLDDYGDIIKKLESRATLLDASQRKAKALSQNAHAKEQQAIFDGLWARARTTGDAHRLERLAAFYQLAHLHGDVNTSTANHVELRKIEDLWLLERTADALAQAYWAEATQAWPKVPLWITAEYGFGVPTEAATYEADEKQWLNEFFGSDGRTDEWQFKRKLLDDIQYHRTFAARLHLDAAEHARMVERAYQLAMKLDPDACDEHGDHPKHSWRRNMSDSLGSLFRTAGLLDESTKYFAEVGRLTDEVWQVKAAAQEVERNKEIAAYLAAHPGALVKEWLLLSGFDSMDKDYREEIVKGLSQKAIPFRARSALASRRELRDGGDFRYTLIGDVPLWAIGSTILHSGPRSDLRRAASFDYYRRQSKSASEEPWLAMADYRHGPKMTASFEVGYQPAADWWDDSLSTSAADLAAAGFVDARPEVVFLFGVEDVDVATTEDPETRGQRLQRGLHGYGVKLDGAGGAALVEVSEPEVRDGYGLDRYRFQYKVLDSASVGGGKVSVSVTVNGKSVKATVGGKTLSATLGNALDGFAGFVFRQPGFAGIDKLKLAY
ncbi:MAG: CsgG/HfaB family protein, partial [Myxococcota bacterium]